MPGANPLKGPVPYSDAESKAFPHSMEFNYLALADLVKGEDRHDWTALDSFLDQVAGGGRQAVFRVHMEFPGRASAIPRYLLKSGLKVRKAPEQKIDGEVTPDYEDPRLRRMLRNFIAALGKRHDGDARIGGITAGLPGHWGEWHTHPDWFASPEAQAEVLDAYEKTFKKTPVLLRYPHDGSAAGYASNVGRGFGFHDDSFAWGTLDTGDPDQSWFYMPALKAAGDSALGTWRVQPIGGEIQDADRNGWLTLGRTNIE